MPCLGALDTGIVTESANRLRDHEFTVEALRWLPDVTRFALSLERDEADADDLVQQTFLKAYEAWHTYTPGTECRGWLFTICRNAFYKRRKREERQVSSDDPELEALAAVAVHASARQGGYDDIFTRFDLSDAIDTAIAALPEVFRDVVLLIDVNDQSYESAAAVLDVPIGTIRSRLFRARRLLQEALISHARDVGLVRPPLDTGTPGQASP